ncbi:serine/threonine/tyrosine protein kinase MPS1 NDAI_0A06620 [Naumovozyma dairenensis CBS 421]|uniref:Protein kinase domain-containing protein n=1 Tax=Naumovozyma dairenensis (strain ATCC 10597 / BCRC 20456 / CBS 421 / NBRC 0211 / NRRL Y-12639) TaxID=1071378 RepID=G0W4S8_NAUDC|nr:hypothetical protein NDAI_0A06620 [Naumovozyma dairenensis CBS 421]CCD22816.1 hypothetical protein NDAI_0A06620 [Naumovozyma dairenensis CBS 421]
MSKYKYRPRARTHDSEQRSPTYSTDSDDEPLSDPPKLSTFASALFSVKDSSNQLDFSENYNSTTNGPINKYAGLKNVSANESHNITNNATQFDDHSSISTIFAHTNLPRQPSITTTNNNVPGDDDNARLAESYNELEMESNLQRIKVLQQSMKEELTSRYVERRNRRFLTSRLTRLGPAKRASSAVSEKDILRSIDNNTQHLLPEYHTPPLSVLDQKEISTVPESAARGNIDYSSIDFGRLKPFEYLKKKKLPTSELPSISKAYFQKQKEESLQNTLKKRHRTLNEDPKIGTFNDEGGSSGNIVSKGTPRIPNLPRRKFSQASARPSAPHNLPPTDKYGPIQYSSRDVLTSLDINNQSPSKADHKFGYDIQIGKPYTVKTPLNESYKRLSPKKKVEIIEPFIYAQKKKTGKKLSITVNGIDYEKIELLGRGGSSKVYKVKNDQNKIFALKRVSFDEFDDSSIAGFKGEIELLEKLCKEPRVVRLFDYQMSSGVLYLIMECGDNDLSQVLNQRMGFPLDMDFLRYHVRELLKCVKAVHDAGIVHSDLKPANFVFIKGLLKLIDFGIANVIPDHTVNVYRESQIGTPNYMAPETLIATNHSIEQSDLNKEMSKWKVGKPSDVWSCGCIIYQMIYGRPPYAGFQGQNRLLAIMNPEVKVIFSERTAKDEKIPTSLIDLMKACLLRDPAKRWSIDKLLCSPFFNPIIVTPFFIKDLIKNAVKYGTDQKTVTDAKIEELSNDVLERLNDFKM